MKIDYCPKCGKAGLKYENEHGLDPDGRSSQSRYQDWVDKKTVVSHYGYQKWCPRCKEWVDPVNRPYVGKSGIA